MDIKIAYKLFDVGNVQVFYRQTHADTVAGLPYREVYWQHIVTRYTYGPFDTIVDAMNHYAWLINMQRKDPKNINGKIIYIDFALKKRIVLGEEIK